MTSFQNLKKDLPCEVLIKGIQINSYPDSKNNFKKIELPKLKSENPSIMNSHKDFKPFRFYTVNMEDSKYVKSAPETKRTNKCYS